MKIKITDAYTEDGKTPILLENIKLSENRHGQIILGFETKNHKYLDISYSIASSHVDGEYCEFGMAKGFEIATQERCIPEGVEREYPESLLTLYLIPENEEEVNKLWAKEAVLPTKWSYEICLVPFHDFYEN
jgi:hypothetical protein